MFKFFLVLTILAVGSKASMTGGDVTLTASDNCVTVNSPNYPNNYPETFDLKKNIMFPSGCSSVDMTFQDTFSITGTEGDCSGRTSGN